MLTSGPAALASSHRSAALSEPAPQPSTGLRASFWLDALHLARAAGRSGTEADGRRMLRTDAWMLLVLFRIRAFALQRRIPFVNRVLRQLQMTLGGVELGNDITLGRGVYLIHSLGTVIGGNAVIGDRVRFLGSNTVGTARDNGYPVIGDDVEVGCGARILGPVRIGAGAVIGANAVVLRDVPAGAVAVGIPARILERRSDEEAAALPSHRARPGRTNLEVA